MASSPGSGASDTTVTLPLCSCRSGYSCDCDARASDRKEPEKRKYTWGKGCDEVAESGNGKVSSLISKRTSRDCIRLMLAKEASEQSPCCSRKCVHKLYTQCGEALVDAVLDRALTVYSGNQNRSFDRLAQVLRGGYESASDKFDYMFDHGGYLRSFDHRGPIYTCGRAWEVLHQVSKHRRLVIQRSVVDNEPTYIRQRKQYESRQTGPREHVRMFLEHFFSDDLGHVEIMPFHDGNSETFKKHLPPWMTKICVYYYYKSWAEDDNAILRELAAESEVKLASFDTFRRTWKEDFPDVTTPKVKRFSHCPICAAGKALRDQAREICTKDMTPEERQVHRQHQQLVRRQVRAEQKVHLERVRQERRDLNNAVFQSRLGHGNFFFFEIDSMDSAKTLLPHWVRIPKTVKPDMLLKYHLTCVKYDGYRPDDIYYYTNTIPHDSSTTCTLIWITIMKEIQHRGRKIPYIRIQMDNTVRENKNRNVAALCNWLVSIGICDVIHLVFLPVGHTHERVDQIFSRISLALSRSSAYTIEAFLDLVAKAFSPTPEIAELSFSLDFSEWLRPHFQDHIQDISKPHKFEFTRDDAAASGGSLRTALWSNTPLSEPVQILKSAPTGTPEIRAGRPLLYALCDKKKPDAVKVQRYLDDFKKVRSYITDLAVQWHFSPVERESWKNLLDDLDEMQTAPSAAFSGFWPQRKEEVDDFLREHGQTAPAEARHTMATNADLNNAEAARVEAEVRAQVLQDDSAFRGVHAGAKERLHDNTSPSDAKGSNLVVIDVSDTKGGKKPVDTSWEKCLTLPWKLVEAVPLSYAKAIHDASGSREVFNEDGTMVRKKWAPGRGGRRRQQALAWRFRAFAERRMIELVRSWDDARTEARHAGHARQRRTDAYLLAARAARRHRGHRGAAAVRAMSEVASMYLQGRLPRWFNRIFAFARLVAPVKKLGEGGAPDVWHVAVGEAKRRAAERAVVDNVKEAYVSVLAPSQLGVGISAGDSMLIHGVRLIAEKLGPRAGIGVPLATTCFCVAIHPEVRQCDITFEVRDEAARFKADDGCLVGLPWPPALHAFRTSIKASVGLEVRFDKMHACNADIEAARREAPADIEWPELKGHHGIPVLNMPLGSHMCMPTCAARRRSYERSLSPYLAEAASTQLLPPAGMTTTSTMLDRGSANYGAAVREAWGRLHAANASYLSDADARMMEREAEVALGSQKELAAFLDQANNSRQNEVCALPVTCMERISFNHQVDAESGMLTVAIPTVRMGMTPREMRKVAALYFFLPSPCMAPVVGSEAILPSREHNPVTVDLYGDALINLPTLGDAH
eukprot:jgi/Tetstr1/455403/TSEL_042235.t1